MNKSSRKKGQAEFIKWFAPLLDALRTLGGSGKPKEVIEEVAKSQKISDAKREETIKSGIPRFDNQVAWARQYLVWEGLLDNSKKGLWVLSPSGQNTYLNDEESRKIFLKWVEIHQKSRAKKQSQTTVSQTQEESENIEISSLLEVLQSLSPSGFEHICKRLLREHGFQNVVVTQASRDGGIDGYGVLELNPFVSMKVLFQCKRYKGTVSRAQIGDFRNAMIGRADKGIILTTGTFSEDAKKEASRDGAPQVELIDGQKLVELFEKAELGLKPKIVYEVDYNFFRNYME